MKKYPIEFNEFKNKLLKASSMQDDPFYNDELKREFPEMEYEILEIRKVGFSEEYPFIVIIQIKKCFVSIPMHEEGFLYTNNIEKITDRELKQIMELKEERLSELKVIEYILEKEKIKLLFL